ncbi:MAG: hypothetical protein PHY33_05890 [Methanobacteriaceae archaeon]|nr:hypothetical protein [Methanobacteriaceae archaeon]MDD4594625.1 hypothetical protein [Methanobacteriaceae archaeon]
METQLNTIKETEIYTKNKQKFLGLRCSNEDLLKLNEVMKLAEKPNKSETIRYCIDYCYYKALSEVKGDY